VGWRVDGGEREIGRYIEIEIERERERGGGSSDLFRPSQKKDVLNFLEFLGYYSY